MTENLIEGLKDQIGSQILDKTDIQTDQSSGHFFSDRGYS